MIGDRAFQPLELAGVFHGLGPREHDDPLEAQLPQMGRQRSTTPSPVVALNDVLPMPCSLFEASCRLLRKRFCQ